MLKLRLLPYTYCIWNNIDNVSKLNFSQFCIPMLYWCQKHGFNTPKWYFSKGFWVLYWVILHLWGKKLALLSTSTCSDFVTHFSWKAVIPSPSFHVPLWLQRVCVRMCVCAYTCMLVSSSFFIKKFQFASLYIISFLITLHGTSIYQRLLNASFFWNKV